MKVHPVSIFPIGRLLSDQQKSYLTRRQSNAKKKNRPTRRRQRGAKGKTTMTYSQAIRKLRHQNAIRIARNYSRRVGLDWNSKVKYVFEASINNPEQVPDTIRSSSGNPEEVVKKWIDKFKKGFEGRISRRASNEIGTVPDSAIDGIIKTRLPRINKKNLNLIKFAHRLSMSTENILGDFLEEYLSVTLGKYGWHCAWGEVIRSADFCSANGSLLQIKNRSNSENSSSIRVRRGTTIEKWHRVDAKTGEYRWRELNRIVGSKLSEERFREFIRKALDRNRAALPVERDNPWPKHKN
jgi:hypothetical protein